MTTLDTVTYLLLDALLLLPWLVIYQLMPALRWRMLKASMVGGFAGLLGECWYSRDYWHPPTLIGYNVLSLEDFLFGFLITGVSCCLYDTLVTTRTIRTEAPHRRLFWRMFLGGVLAMLVLNTGLGFNSMIVSCGAFVFFTAIMVGLRPDLLGRAILSGLLVVLAVVPAYLLLFNLINPGYWDRYWLLTGSALGVKILGEVPLTELLWYLCWGSLAGIAHQFASGEVRLKV